MHLFKPLGKVELKNLSVKENALDSLDVPFHIIHGRIGKLSADIPWSSLYTSPVVLNMSNILVVAAPTTSELFSVIHDMSWNHTWSMFL